MIIGDKKVSHMPKSTSKEKTVNKKKMALGLLGDALVVELFRTDIDTKIIHPYDHLGVHYISDCPACPACNWVPLGLEV